MEQEEKNRETAEFLRQKGIRPSLIRIKVYQYLENKKNHPTVDMVYKGLRQKIPTLSRTSIYNTLRLFADEGIADEVVIEENEVRYDADTKQHAHFKCVECGAVQDVEIRDDSCKFEGLEGVEIFDRHVYFRGICKKCKKK